MSKRQGFSFLIVLLLSMLALPGMAQDLAGVEAAASGLSFTPNQATGFVLTVSAPDGTVSRHAFAAGQLPALATGGFADGIYTWELTPVAAPRDRDGETPVETARLLQSGSFTVAGGTLVSGGTEQGQAAKNTPMAMGPMTKDQVILDDLIVDGSACIGFDCVNGESFGFDTLRLKENNLRIKFQDTSASASFPSNDWQLTVNDSSNGGANKFSIDDIDGGRTPFTIEASAPSNSLYVDDGGRVGLGTATPVVELHVVDGDSPTLRLEQNGSSGFTPQTWDVAANETNFFVRDATNGSRLPFKIRPSAPTNSLYVNTNGDIGLGTASPDAKLHALGKVRIESGDTGADGEDALLHIKDAGAQTQLVIQETTGTNNLRNLIELSNNGATRIVFDDTRSATNWSNAEVNEDFTISTSGTGVAEFTFFRTGNMTMLGTLTQNSDRDAKTDFEPIDGAGILEKVASLPITEWRYKDGPENVRHIGPMAQDFYAAFGLNGTETGISTLDTSGVAIAAIQALYSELGEKDERIDQLAARNSDLEARLAALEAMVEAIANSNN